MQMSLLEEVTSEGKPFLKWAGGKGQLLKEFNKRLPDKVRKSKKIDNYVEPFIGGGAMFFFLRKNYNIKKSTILDINKELIIGYKVIQNDYKKLVDELADLEDDYLVKPEDERKEHYYNIRTAYNEQMTYFDYDNYNDQWIERAKYLIFLNKTGFNGLFRQNKKGEFNVPVGRYKKPKICDEKNIAEVNKALRDTSIILGDFSNAAKHVDNESFIYLDPPYRPLNKTSSFTAYTKDGFNDDDQRRLAEFFREMNKKGAKLMLSNSDPKNHDPNDNFFDELYHEFSIERVPAKRFINCDASKRGAINEIIVRNY